MPSQSVTIINKSGLHARPANVFIKEALSHKCDVIIKKGDKEYNGKSIVSVLSACIKCGSDIEIITNGEGADQCLASMVAAVKKGLGET